MSNLKVYNGSEWVVKPLKVFNGSAWVVKPLKMWNGSSWVVIGGISNLLAYGTFDNSDGWYFGSNWGVINGVCRKTPYGMSNCDIIDKFLDFEKTYSVTYTVTNSTGGQLKFYSGFGGGNYETIPSTTNGTFTETFTTAPNTYGWENNFGFGCNWGFDGDLDNIIVELL